MLGVEDWAEVRRLHLAEGWSIKRITRERGFARNTVRMALRSERPPGYQRGPRGSKLDPFTEEVERLLGEDGRLPGEVILGVLREHGYDGGRSILGDYLREVRPRFVAPRSTQRTRYEPGELCQFDVWHPSRLIPVGHEQQRAGYVVVATLGYSRAAAAAVVFSKDAPDLLWGITRCLWRLGGLPRKLVWDREGALHGGLGRPSEAYAQLLGMLAVGGVFCRAGDPQAKGVVERFQGYLETSFEPGRSWVNEHDYQHQLDRWIVDKANQRVHRALRARPAELLAAEQRALRVLPAEVPDLDRRLVVRVGHDPYLRFDTCDYSLDPRLVGRRVAIRVSQTEISGVALDTADVACRHRRCRAKHRTITDPEHQRQLRRLRAERLDAADRPRAETAVEVRALTDYDALIPV
jgi:transposase